MRQGSAACWSCISDLTLLVLAVFCLLQFSSFFVLRQDEAEWSENVEIRHLMLMSLIYHGVSLYVSLGQSALENHFWPKWSQIRSKYILMSLTKIHVFLASTTSELYNIPGVPLKTAAAGVSWHDSACSSQRSLELRRLSPQSAHCLEEEGAEWETVPPAGQ